MQVQHGGQDPQESPKEEVKEEDENEEVKEAGKNAVIYLKLQPHPSYMHTCAIQEASASGRDVTQDDFLEEKQEEPMKDEENMIY